MQKKIILILSSLLISIISFSQPIINRTFGTNTVNDPRLSATLNFLGPRYNDTAAANIQIGIDSCAALIFTYSDDSYWLRACNPKRWVKILKTGDVSNTVWGSITGTLSNQTDLQNALNLKLNISDTSSMLLPYLKKVDTTNKWLNVNTRFVDTIIRSNDSTIVFNIRGTTYNIELLGRQTIQQTLANGDTALRKIIFKDTASAASTHNFTTETLVPTNYNTAYTFGRQGLYNRGISYTVGVNASGRPNVVNSILSYNQNAGSGGRLLTDEASFGIRAETHFETGGSRLFEFFFPEMMMQDGTLYRPNAWYIAKDARSAVWNGQLSAFTGLYLPPAGSAFDSVMFSHTAAGHTFQTFDNGSLIFRNARNTLNSFSIALTDNGPNIAPSSSSSTTMGISAPINISHTSNLPTLSVPATPLGTEPNSSPPKNLPLPIDDK